MNRIDEIVVFEPLAREEIRQIVDIQLAVLQQRLAERKLTLELTDAAREYLANEGYDPAFGARPLKRLIQREIQDPLAMKLLVGRDPRRRHRRDRHRRRRAGVPHHWSRSGGADHVASLYPRPEATDTPE